LKKEREKNHLHAIHCAVKITSICRVRIARKKMSALRRLKRSAVKIQKRIRIFLARRCVARRRLRHRKAVVIQTRMRVVLAKARVARLIEANAAGLNRLVTLIQKNVRRKLAGLAVRAMRKDKDSSAKVSRAGDDKVCALLVT
jgi:hypothetical protein